MRRGLGTLACICGLLLSACAGSEHSGTPSQQLRTWVSGTTLAVSTAGILKDLHQVDVALISKQTNAVQTTCSVMNNDAVAANSNLPSPNSTVSLLLSNAYSQVGLGANACFVALSRPSKLASYRNREHQARSLFAEAGAIIQSVTGQKIAPAPTQH